MDFYCLNSIHFTTKKEGMVLAKFATGVLVYLTDETRQAHAYTARALHIPSRLFYEITSFLQ